MKEAHGHNTNKKFGMVIDLDKCTGCGACMVACMAENNVPFKKDESDKLQHHLDAGLQADQRQTLSRPMSAICPGPACIVRAMHGHSPCVSVCPATATDYSMETGIVSQIYTRCFGCRYCMAACPYHARYFNWWDPVWPDGNGKIPQPGCVRAHAGCGGKVQLLLPPLPAGLDKAYL
jgi:Fe-S-cluster-containing dehydrogenase component